VRHKLPCRATTSHFTSPYCCAVSFCRPNFWFVALTFYMSFAQMSLVLDATCLVFLNFRLELPPSNRRTGPPSHRFDPFPQLFSRSTCFSSCFLLLSLCFLCRHFRMAARNATARVVLSRLSPLHSATTHPFSAPFLHSCRCHRPSPFQFQWYTFFRLPFLCHHVVFGTWSFGATFFSAFSRCLCTNFQRILAGPPFLRKFPANLNDALPTVQTHPATLQIQN